MEKEIPRWSSASFVNANRAAVFFSEGGPGNPDTLASFFHEMVSPGGEAPWKLSLLVPVELPLPWALQSRGGCDLGSIHKEQQRAPKAWPHPA